MTPQLKLGVCCRVLAALLIGVFLGICLSPHGESIAYVTQDERGNIVHHGGVEYRLPF